MDSTCRFSCWWLYLNVFEDVFQYAIEYVWWMTFKTNFNFPMRRSPTLTGLRHKEQFSKPFCRNTAQLLISILIASTYKAIPFMKRDSISDICFENWRYQGEVWLGAHGRASLCVTKVCSAGLLHHCPHGKRRPSQNERWAPRLIPSKLAFNLLVLTPILQPSKYWVF